MGVGGVDTCVDEGIADAAPEFALGRPLHVGVGYRRHPQRPRVRTEFVDAGQLGPGDEVGLDRLLERRTLGGLDGDIAGAVDVRAVGDRDLEERHTEVLAVVAHAQDVAVAAVPQGSVQVAQRGDPQTHVLDGALGLAQVDPVAHAVLVLEEHEDPREEVTHQRLGAEAERHAHDPGRGDERRHVHPDYRQRLQDHPDEDDEGHQRLEHRPDRGHALGSPLRPLAVGHRLLGGLAVCLLEALGGQSTALVGADPALLVVVLVDVDGGPCVGLPAATRPQARGGAVRRGPGDAVDGPVQEPAHQQRQKYVHDDHDRLLHQPFLRRVGHPEIGEGNG